MDKTTHYGLNKPGYDEPADIAALNENADITDTVLAGKVDKVSGKQLSTEDYTTAEKTKLAGVEAGANNYSHPATHSADMIEDNPAKRFVNETQIATWSTKETPAGAQAKADAAENNAKAYAGDKSALLTTEKTTIVSAVNELFTNVGNGKDLIASAITGKGVPASGSDTFPVLAGKIEDIPAGGEYGTATAAEVLEGYTLGTEGGVVNGALALSGDALPANVLAGKTFYNTNAKSKLTGTIPAKGSQTYTPGTTNQIIAGGQYLTGPQTIAGSANLLAANIKEGVNIFNVIGTLPGVQKASVSISSYSFTNRQFEMEHSDSVDYITDDAQDLSVSLSFVPNFIYVRGGFIFLNDGICVRALVGGSGYGERYYWLKVNVPTDKCVIITQSRLYLPISGMPGDVFYVYRLPF